MRKPGILVVAPLLVVGAAGLAQQPAGDQSFVQQAMAGGQQEVAAGKLAESQAGAPTVRMFGRWMATDHTLIGQIFAEHAAPMGNSPAAAASTGELDALSKLHDKQFDERYLADQVSAHEKTIALFEQEASSGQDATLKRIAQDVLPALREHLAMAKELQARPVGAPEAQTSLPTSAPPATTTQNTAATNQSPVVKQMNEAEKKKVEVEGK